MATAKLPCNLKAFQREVTQCLTVVSDTLNRLAALVDAFYLNKKITLLQNKKPWVLIIESDPIQRYVHQKALEEAGCEVEIAVSSHEALNMMDRGFDLILISTLFPDKGDLKFAARFWLHEQRQRPRLVGISNKKTDKASKKQYAKAGIKKILETPLRVCNKKVTNRIKRLFSKFLLQYFPTLETIHYLQWKNEFVKYDEPLLLTNAFFVFS